MYFLVYQAKVQREVSNVRFRGSAPACNPFQLALDRCCHADNARRARVAFVAHGGQKLFGWFGGTGIAGTTTFFTSVGLPDPHAFAYVSGILEFFGGVAIALGFLTVPAALALIVEMIIAVASVSYKAGFFVTAQKIGWELNVYLLGLLAAVLITGPGAWSLDAALGLTRRTPAAAGPAAVRRTGQRSASY